MLWRIFMYKGINTYHINSCETIEVFYNIRIDLDKLEYAVHITKIIQDVTDENQNCYKFCNYTKYIIYNIRNRKRFRFSIKHFQIKLLCFLGFTPKYMNVQIARKRKI